MALRKLKEVEIDKIVAGFVKMVRKIPQPPIHEEYTKAYSKQLRKVARQVVARFVEEVDTTEFLIELVEAADLDLDYSAAIKMWAYKSSKRSK